MRCAHNKDVLGMWVGENESAKYWATVLNGLKKRGVEDIFIACTDNLTGFSAAIGAVFPKTEIQNCSFLSRPYLALLLYFCPIENISLAMCKEFIYPLR